MKCVYLLESLTVPGKRYVGIAADLDQRLTNHNTAKSPHTKRYAPWKCVVAVWFDDHARADAFEIYLKSGSGHAFARRHFW